MSCISSKLGNSVFQQAGGYTRRNQLLGIARKSIQPLKPFGQLLGINPCEQRTPALPLGELSGRTDRLLASLLR